jgi:transcriptional regulator CtsR
MARLSDNIEALLKQMIEQNDGSIEITRNELAEQVKCVPSQITYVLTTRFTNSQGYLVESRRGGGGWIRITRVVHQSAARYLMHALNNIGDSLSQHQTSVLVRNFLDYSIINQHTERLLLAATSDQALVTLEPQLRDIVRMNIFKNMLISLITTQESTSQK